MIEVGNNSVNGMFVGASQVARMYLGADLVYDNTPPAGRTINVGDGSGTSLVIDGANLTYEGSPTTAQLGDTIVIAPGNYTFTSWPRGSITIQNFNLPSGFCKIKAGGDLNLDGNIQFFGATPNKGVDLDFDNVNVTFSPGWGDVIVIDESAVGGYERIKIGNITHDITPEDTYFIRHKGISVPYNNGSGIVSIKDLELHNINLDGGGSFPIVIGGEFDSGDNGYCEDVYAHHITFTGPGTTGSRLRIQNCEGFIVHDVEGVNLDVPLDENTPHCRFIFLKGRGVAFNNSLQGSSGAVVAIEMFSRAPGQICRAYNNWSYDSARYSAVEFRSNSAFIQPDVTYVCEGEGDFNSFYTTLNTGVYGCSAYDLYDNVSTVYRLRNSVSVNPQQGGAGQIWNGSVITPPVVSDCVVSADNSDTMLSAFMTPSPGSVLIGAGVAVLDITTDAIGTERPDPPTVGAFEGFN